MHCRQRLVQAHTQHGAGSAHEDAARRWLYRLARTTKLAGLSQYKSQALQIQLATHYKSHRPGKTPSSPCSMGVLAYATQA